MEKTTCYLFAVLLLISCEYKVHDNFVHVEKPVEEISMSYDLNALTDGQAILINQETHLNYSLSAFGKNIQSIRFTMGDKTWNYSDMEPNGSIHILQSEFPKGEYTLTCEMFVPSGSGSIADQLGAEGYSSTVSWPVIVDYDMDLPEVISYRRNPEGFFELYWAKPVLSHLKIKSYTINREFPYFRYHTFTAGAEETTFVDKQNAGFESTYSITMNLLYEGKTDLSWPVGKVEIPDQIHLHVVSSGIDHAVVGWDVPYKCHATYQIGNEAPQVAEEGNTSITVPVLQFGSSAWWDQTKVTLAVASVDDPSETIYAPELYVGSPGVYLENERLSEWVYNPVTGLLYANSHGKLVNAYTADDIKPAFSSQQVINHTRGFYSSPTSGMIVCMTQEQLFVMDARSLTVLRTVSDDVVNPIGITKDNKLVYYSFDDKYDYIAKACDIHTGETEEIAVDAGNPLILSSDGKYMFYSFDFNLHKLTLENYQPVSHTTHPYGAYFEPTVNPAFPDQLVMLFPYSGKIELRRCEDLSLQKEIVFENEIRIGDIDPVTGNLLVIDGNRAKIISPVTGTVLFSLKIVPSARYSLIHNILISEDGYLLNIQEYLQP